MKNKEHRLCKQLYKLRYMAKIGHESVIWKLSKDQVDFLGKYYEIEPYLYRIETKKFNYIHEIKETLLKTIHYERKHGKKEMLMKLSNKQKELLDEYDVRYRPFKYRIVLIKR